MFTNSKKFDFPPELQFSDGTLLELKSEKKLLGVIISNDLKWRKNTTFMVSKARQKLWILQRAMPLNFSVMELFDIYTKEVRSILEYAVPVWHSSLSRKDITDIEAVQKFAFRIILRKQYSSYSDACNFFGTQTLDERRQMICLRFVSKNLESENSLFKLSIQNERLQPRKQKVQEFKCNTSRFQRSSLPYLSQLANSQL